MFLSDGTVISISLQVEFTESLTMISGLFAVIVLSVLTGMSHMMVVLLLLLLLLLLFSYLVIFYFIIFHFIFVKNFGETFLYSEKFVLIYASFVSTVN